MNKYNIYKTFGQKGNVSLSLVSAPEVHNHPVGEDIAYVARMRLVLDIRDGMRATPITQQNLGKIFSS